MDIIISVVVLLLLAGTIIILLVSITDKQIPSVAYGGVVIKNIELINDSTTAFLTDYRIEEVKLSAFASQPYSQIKNTLLSGSEFGQQNEVCVFFLNKSTVVPVNGTDQFGHTTCNFNSPCQDYVQSFVFAKPVLRMGDIIIMYVAVCE